MNSRNKILAVSHDSGGAEIVSAYAKGNKVTSDFFCLAEGPAKNIFERKGLDVIDRVRAEKLIKEKKIDLVITSTSGASSLELDLIEQAKNVRIKSVSYLDHWLNYRERFGYPMAGWEDNLPNEIWVGDKEALKIAADLFLIPVLLVPNLFFEEIKKEFQLKRGTGDSVLFMCEPISVQFQRSGVKIEGNFDEIEILILILERFAINKPKQIILRLHPSEPRNKYDSLIIQFKGRLNIIKSENNDILDDIAQSRLVIGMSSMALVVAGLCGKKTVSFMPGEKDCPLPFKNIIKIKSIDQLNNLIS